MQATIVKDGEFYAHDYPGVVPRVGETIHHKEGDREVQGVVDEVHWISGSERVGDEIAWLTIVRLNLR